MLYMKARLARVLIVVALVFVVMAGIGLAARSRSAGPAVGVRRVAVRPTMAATVAGGQPPATHAPVQKYGSAGRGPTPTVVARPRPTFSAPGTPRDTSSLGRRPALSTGDTGAFPQTTSGQRSATALFDPYTPSASITIPRLNMRAPVYERGIDAARRLPIAPGYAVTHYWYSGALGRPGNYVVYGHDDIEGNVFQYLPIVRVGDHVYLDSGARRYDYRVVARTIVSPRDIPVMAPTRTATLTLISCYPFNVDSQRIVITAALAR